MTLTENRSIPTLRTERLQLVPLGRHHFSAFAELHADPETMRHIGDGKILDRVGAWFHMAMLIGHWHLRDYGVWAIEEAETGEMVGRAGLLHPEGWADPELNWMIRPSMRGKGYAVEAARRVLDFALNERGFEQVISLIRPENSASRHIATKLGGVMTETINFMHSPMLVFRYTKRP